MNPELVPCGSAVYAGLSVETLAEEPIRRCSEILFVDPKGNVPTPGPKV